MTDKHTEKTTGILNPGAVQHKFQLTRYAPEPDIAFFVERYWLIHWDLRRQPSHVQETLSYPCVNLVFERGNTWIWGVDSGKFVRRLEGMGQVFGVKFKPGGFYPFIKRAVSSFTDQALGFREVFGSEPVQLEDQLFGLDDADQIGVVENFLRSRLPPRDENIPLVNAIIDCVTSNQMIQKVDDLAPYFNLSKRSLQRLFSQYVGVSPKWVIQRHRIQEAADQITAGRIVNWAALALSLGYFDQAHFIKDFKAMIGKTPLEYQTSLEKRPDTPQE